MSKENGCKITAGATPTFLYLNTRIEQPYKLSNKELTLSFYMSCQNGSRDVWIRHRRDGEVSSTIEEVTINNVDTRYSVTFTSLDMDTQTADGDYYQIEILIGDSNSVSSGDEFTIRDVQLEEGSVATPFEQRPYGLELSLCQRYYQTIGCFSERSTADIGLDLGFNFSKMRDAPTVTRVGDYMSPYTNTTTIVALQHT